MKLHLCDKCGNNLNGIKFTFFDVLEIPRYAVRKNETLEFELCDKCIKQFNKFCNNFLNEKGGKNKNGNF